MQSSGRTSREFRSREISSAMLVFFPARYSDIQLCLELDIVTRQTVNRGRVMGHICFCRIFGLNRSMAVEKDRGCLDDSCWPRLTRGNYFGKSSVSGFHVDRGSHVLRFIRSCIMSIYSIRVYCWSYYSVRSAILRLEHY